MPKCRIALGLAGLILAAVPAFADEYVQYPVTAPYYAGQHSYPTASSVVIPPYPYAFPVRIYTVPPQQPYYNVPPYAVITPY